MPTTLVVRSDGRTDLHTELARPGQDEHRWIDLTSPGEADLGALATEFGFHPMALDDVRTYDQRPKLEEFGDHLFVVIHCLVVDRPSLSVTSEEIHAFVSPTYLVTAHASELPELAAILRRVAAEPELAKRGPAFWLYLLADRVALRGAIEIDVLGEAAEELEEAVLERNAPHVLERLLGVKRALATARRLIAPQRDVFASLAKLDSQLIPRRTALYFRDTYDLSVRSLETLDSQRELATSVLDAHFSMLSQRTNEIVKHLTLLSSIFLPLTFVTGFFGQNFEHMPFASDRLMWTGIASCIVLPAAMLAWFRFKHWI